MSKKTKKTQSFSSINIKDALKQKADLALLGTTFRSNVNLQSIMWAASIYCKTLDSEASMETRVALHISGMPTRI